MATYLKVEGNIVTQVREEVLKTFPLASFIAGIEDGVPVDSGMLPRNCVYFKQVGQLFVYVVEIPAQMVAVRTRLGSHEEKHYRIHIPFTQFYVSGNPTTKAIGSIYLTATKRPLRSLTEPVFTTPYPNIHGEGTRNLCTGSMSIPSDIDLDAKINVVCSEFFTAAFNQDLHPGCPNGWSWRGVDPYFEHWQRLSTQNRCLMLSDEVELRPYPKTPAEIVDNLLSGGAR